MRHLQQRQPAASRREAAQKALASAVIVAMVGFQALTSFDWISRLPGLRHRRGYYWPFLDYPMYKSAHYAGEQFTRYVLIGVWPDGTETPLPPAAFGLNFWKFEKGPVRALQQRDAALLRLYLAHYAQRHHRCPAAVRLENHPWVLGPAGVTGAPPQVISTLSVDAEACR